jgi:hypothetical protein
MYRDVLTCDATSSDAPFILGIMQTHSKSASKSSSQGNEEQSEDKKMEVDLVVALEPWPIEQKVTSSTRILFGTAHGFDEAKGATPTEATTHSHGKVDQMLFDTIAKDE